MAAIRSSPVAVAPVASAPVASAPVASAPYSASSQYGILFVCASIVTASILMTIRDGESVRFLAFPELPEMCQFRIHFGYPCPGCGLTRSFVSMGHFDFAGAWRYHPVGLFLYLIVVFQIPFRGVQIARHHRGLPQCHLGTLPIWVCSVLAGAVVIQWLVRIVGAE